LTSGRGWFGHIFGAAAVGAMKNCDLKHVISVFKPFRFPRNASKSRTQFKKAEKNLCSFKPNHFLCILPFQWCYQRINLILRAGCFRSLSSRTLPAAGSLVPSGILGMLGTGIEFQVPTNNTENMLV
jgi:hypothetical protein